MKMYSRLYWNAFVPPRILPRSSIGPIELIRVPRTELLPPRKKRSKIGISTRPLWGCAQSARTFTAKTCLGWRMKPDPVVTVGIQWVVRTNAFQKSRVPPSGPPAYSKETLVRCPRDGRYGLSTSLKKMNGRRLLVVRLPCVRKSDRKIGLESEPKPRPTFPMSMTS